MCEKPHAPNDIIWRCFGRWHFADFDDYGWASVITIVAAFLRCGHGRFQILLVYLVVDLTILHQFHWLRMGFELCPVIILPAGWIRRMIGVDGEHQSLCGLHWNEIRHSILKKLRLMGICTLILWGSLLDEAYWIFFQLGLPVYVYGS